LPEFPVAVDVVTGDVCAVLFDWYEADPFDRVVAQDFGDFINEDLRRLPTVPVILLFCGGVWNSSSDEQEFVPQLCCPPEKVSETRGLGDEYTFLGARPRST
jgi:hypothetical protein